MPRGEQVARDNARKERSLTVFTDIPRPDASQFTTSIDNPFMPLRPGTTFVYENSEDGEEVRVTVTDETRVVDGVTTVVVHDTARVNGLVIEDTYDWYAQDADGNVWYFGEETAEYDPGNPDPVSTEGSWEAGVDGAEPGVVMLADPEVGIRYRQEYFQGEAEDWAEVKSLDARTHVPYGSFDEVLKTLDVNPLDPSTEHKFYAEGVGNLLATDEEGAREALVRIEVEGGAGNDKLLGYAGGDMIRGHGGRDLIRGYEGNDTLAGGSGRDKLWGGEGFDVLCGGRGNDHMWGGEDGDTFVFQELRNGKAETDTISDYDAREIDVLKIAGGAGSVVAETETGDGWTLTLAGDGDVICLLGVSDDNGNGHIVDDLLFA
jgi:RTX calcium-binding nonapeptide repeat (4 copies)